VKEGEEEKKKKKKKKHPPLPPPKKEPPSKRNKPHTPTPHHIKKKKKKKKKDYAARWLFRRGGLGCPNVNPSIELSRIAERVREEKKMSFWPEQSPAVRVGRKSCHRKSMRDPKDERYRSFAAEKGGKGKKKKGKKEKGGKKGGRSGAEQNAADLRWERCCLRGECLIPATTLPGRRG